MFVLQVVLDIGLLAAWGRDLLHAKAIRLLMWATYLDYWWQNANIWVGTGPGSFEVIGPTLGIANPTVANGPAIYSTAWAHNDWLQILFEYGILGLTLFSAAFLYVSYRAFRRSAYLFASLMAYGTCMLFYSPVHFFVSQLLLIIWIRSTFHVRPTSSL